MKTRSSPPLVVLVEAVPMLRFLRYSVIFFLDPRVIFGKILYCNYRDIIYVHHIVAIHVI
jgi:hypothetical protein